MASPERSKPFIGVTLGDPCGIGPEIVLRALAPAALRQRADFVVLGGAAVLRRVAKRLGLDASFLRTRRVFTRPTAGEVTLLNAVPVPAGLALRGEPTNEGGAASVELVEQGIDLAMGGHIDALVTAPVSKKAIERAGLDWPGQTELLQARTGADRAVMTMVGGGLRVALVTTHLAVSDLRRALTKRPILETIRIFAEALRRDFGLPDARLAVCGFNPHGGEGGRFGDLEQRSIEPAIVAAAEQGIPCEGPVPADAVFHQALQGRWDGVVAMYHDQGCIPVKLLAFDSGVNVTLGLPIIRTSPDHGTAYDIVGRGGASPGSMTAAIDLAIDMAHRRAEENPA